MATGLVLHGVAFVSMDAPLLQAYATLDDAIPDDSGVDHTGEVYEEE